MLKIRIKQNLAYLLIGPPNQLSTTTSSNSPSGSRSTLGSKPSHQHPLNRGEGSADSFASPTSPASPTFTETHLDRPTSPGAIRPPIVDLTPSTQGGLVLPPFPPLVRKERDKGRSPSGQGAAWGEYEQGRRQALGPGSGSGSGVQGYTHQTLSSQPGNSLASASSSTQDHLQQSLNSNSRVVPPDPSYDEEAAIGGKVLPGRLRPREAEGGLMGVWKLLDEFER